MKAYRLTDRYCRWTAFKRALFALVVLLLCVGGGLLFLALRSLLTTSSVWPFGLLLIVACLYLPFGAWRAYTLLASYRLSLSEDNLTQSMRGASDVTVDREAVTEIIETPATYLVVRTADYRRWIMVFDGLEEYADLRARLEEWHDIKILPRRSPLSLALRQAAILFPSACLAAAFFASSPYVVVPSASAGAAAMVVTLWMMQRSPHAPTWAKAASWLLLLAVALAAVRIAVVCGLVG